MIIVSVGKRNFPRVVIHIYIYIYICPEVFMVIMVAIVIVMMLNDDLLKKTDDESTGSRKPAQAG